MGSQRKYYLDDWLNLHGFNRDQIWSILNNISPQIFPERKDQIQFKAAFSLSEAKNLIFRSFQSELGFKHAETLLSEIKLKPQGVAEEFPYTVDNGARETPSIICSYHNDARTILNLAHEYAHALQLILSDGKFMPPAYREVCAFLGERALAKFTARESCSLAKAIQSVWYLDNFTYLDADLKSFIKAINHHKTEYNYRWNYPIARILASNIDTNKDKKFVIDLFCNSGLFIDNKLLTELNDW